MQNQAPRTPQAKNIPVLKGRHNAIFMQEIHEAIAKGHIGPEILVGLRNGSITQQDHTIYANKAVSEKTNVEMIQIKDGKEAGITNLNKGQLEKNEVFYCTGIKLMGAQGNGADQEASLPYGEIIAEVANGDFTFKANKKEVLSDTGSGVFVKESDEEKCLWTLEKPIIIGSQTTIEMNGQWGPATPPNYYMRLELQGLILR